MEPTMMKPRLKMAMAAAEMLYSAKERKPQSESLSRHFLLSGFLARVEVPAPRIPILHRS